MHKKTDLRKKERAAPLLAIFCFILCWAAPPSRAQAAFGYRKSITVQSGQVSSGPHSSFPVLVSTTDADLKSVANGGHVQSANGYDIVFRATDSTTCGGAAVCTLDHEVERYSPTTGELVAWVRVPSLDAGTVIYVYYGDSGISSSTENKTGVWATNYVGVWHLPDGTTLSAADSTSNGYNGTITSATATAGNFDGAASFSGSSSYVSISSVSPGNAQDPMTLSYWLYRDNTDVDTSYPLSLDYSFNTNGGIGLRNDRFRMQLASSSTAVTMFYTAVSKQTWHYVAFTKDSGNAAVYVDGSLATSTTHSVSGSMVNNVGRHMAARHSTGGLIDFYKGYLDEVRVCNVVRSLGWITTEFNNQNAPGTFYAVGIEESNPPSAVDLAVFQAVRGEDGVLLRWQTCSEARNLGFHLWRQNADGTQRITTELIGGSALLTRANLTAGRRYSWLDPSPGRAPRYWLEDLDLGGRRTWSGPADNAGRVDCGHANRLPTQLEAAQSYRPGRQPEPYPRALIAPVAMAEPLPEVRLQASIAPVLPRRPAAPWSPGSPGSVKISIDSEGWYRLRLDEVLSAGLDAGADARRLQLFAEGEEVPLSVRSGPSSRLRPDDSIEFYGTGIDTPASATRVYWLVQGTRAGRRIPFRYGRGLAASPPSFPFTVELKERKTYFSGHGPRAPPKYLARRSHPRRGGGTRQTRCPGPGREKDVGLLRRSYDAASLSPRRRG